MALESDPRATVLGLATTLNAARNTVQSRLNRLYARGVVRSFQRCIDPAAIGYSLTAFITAEVVQRQLADVAAALDAIPEVIEVVGMSGSTDLLIRVVATDAEDLYRIAGRILATDGVQRTQTSLAMRQLVEYRIDPLLRRITDRDA